MRRWFFLIPLCLFLVSAASAQFFYYFGRNKVQYTDFEWNILETEHFDIYYYPEMKALAERGGYLAEESYRALEERFNHNVAGRIPLIFYSSHLHFQQTNTTPGFIPENIGGFFEFIKGRVVIPYDGSMSDFRHVIRHELVHVFMHSKINRILLDHRITQDHLPPLWFTEGLAEYWSSDWDMQAEMLLRDAVITGYLVPLDDMDRIYGSFQMYKEGQAILQYVAEHYGPEKILSMMEDFWKSNTFEDVFTMVVGKNYRQFDEDWTYAMKKRYFPLLAASDQPAAVSRSVVSEGFNSKPVFYRRGNSREMYFVGNYTGYTSIYSVSLDSEKAKPSLVIEGERTEELEAFHVFQSKLAVSASGVLAFVTKSGESDVIHLYDIASRKIVQTLHFKDLVVVASPSWSPDGNRLVFSAVDKSGSSDLYMWDFGRSRLTRLTNDTYDDRDPAWSPADDRIAFSSDRSPYGALGKYNLFLYSVATGDIAYMTCGPESYYAPSWSGDGRSLLFTCDVDGARNIWMMRFDSTGNPPAVMRRLTSFTTAAFDPAWAESTMVFVAFERFSFQLRALGGVDALYDSSAVSRPVNRIPDEAPWRPGSLSAAPETRSRRYTGEYGLDVAESQVSNDPIFGTAGGAFLSLSDILGNEQYYFLLLNTASATEDILESFNIAISRISLGRRTNYSYGIYRFSGPRYDETDPDVFFFERAYGGYFSLSYPLSHFRRIDAQTSLTNSAKDLSGYIGPGAGYSPSDNIRRALFLSNQVSFVHDNSLWGSSGPMDGTRFNVTLAYTTDIEYAHANYYSVMVDYREYFRIALRSAYAVRLWMLYNDGTEARRFIMGGSWDLRGYPRWSLRGKKLWLTSHELRFPLLDELNIRFPFGGMALGGFRGALFFDAGSVWDDTYEETLGSTGVGLRLNIAGGLVLRYDIGKRIEENFHHFQNDLFYQFFFGWDF
jgi:hypothetical protein